MIGMLFAKAKFCNEVVTDVPMSSAWSVSPLIMTPRAMSASFGLFSIKCLAHTGISKAPGTLYTGTVMLGIIRLSSSIVELSNELTSSSL